MNKITYIRWVDPPWWKAAIATSLPLWLLSIMVMPLPINFGSPSLFFLLIIIVTVGLLWLRWLTPELILYSLAALMPLFAFEEVPSDYKLPFMLLCALILSSGIAGYQFSLYKDSLGTAWLFLLLTVVVTWLLATHASQNYWNMLNNLGYNCVPGRDGCPPLSGNVTPWWLLFFK